MSRERFRRALDQALALDNDLARRARRALDTSEAARKAWITRRAGGAKPPEPAQPRVKAPEPPAAAPPQALPPQHGPSYWKAVPQKPGAQPLRVPQHMIGAGIVPQKPANWAQMSPGKKAAWTKAARLMAGIGMKLPQPVSKPPVAPGAKQTAYEHFKQNSKITNFVSRENAEKIVGVLDKLNLTGLVEKFPVEKVVFDSWDTGRPGVRGYYRAKWPGLGIQSELHVMAEFDGEIVKIAGGYRRIPYVPMTWSPGFRPNASSLGKDGLEARQITFTHELGHHFNNQFNVALHQQQIAAYAHALRTRSHVSEYAKTNKNEYFAECWAYYHFHPEILQRVDPAGYNLVEQAKKFFADAPGKQAKAA